jgi:hypothetical protein
LTGAVLAGAEFTGGEVLFPTNPFFTFEIVDA